MENNNSYVRSRGGIASTYRGVRKRKWSKWVTEIREPGKKTRICLGSLDTQEMEAIAYDDVAAFHFRGHKAVLNFPELADQLPCPASSKAQDAAAALHLRGGTLNPYYNIIRATAQPSYASSSSSPTRVGLSPMQIQAINESPLESPQIWSTMTDAHLIDHPFIYSNDFEMVDGWEDEVPDDSLWNELTNFSYIPA